MWRHARSVRALEKAAQLMVDIPSLEWRPYLDELFVAKRQPPSADEFEASRIDVLRRFEDDLYLAVGEALADQDGQVTHNVP